ncbi:MAG TPA: hypothetical protein VK548_20745 [Candidatus Acidoferrum sp.]|nr:hypothetical protein [Candidatus Acidoferrum sp.]
MPTRQQLGEASLGLRRFTFVRNEDGDRLAAVGDDHSAPAANSGDVSGQSIAKRANAYVAFHAGSLVTTSMCP